MQAGVSRLAAALVMIMSVAACAQTRPDAAPPPAEPPPVPRAPNPLDAASSSLSVESTPMPGERIERPTLLDDQMAALRAALPNFNVVIVRDPGVPKDYPTLPAMTLKNVTVGQFLEFIQASYPGMQLDRINGPTGTLYAINIRMTEEAVRRNQVIEERNRVRLFRLNEYINALADESPAKDKPREERVKEATAQVLSLLQAALEETDDGDGPTVVRIHEPTLTLLFKGSQAKQAVLQEALATLHPQAAWAVVRDEGSGRSVSVDTYGRWRSGQAGQAQSPPPPWARSSTPHSSAQTTADQTTAETFRKLLEDKYKAAEREEQLARRLKEVEALQAELAKLKAATQPTSK
jgi:hypothetical protein